VEYLNELNDAQKEAVLHQDGPLLIVAGAGAGKTKTVTHRILHLIKSGVTPGNILAVTFTNKAAKEMSERLQKLLNTEPRSAYAGEAQPFTSTFHSLAVHILRQHAHTLGFTRFFTILDREGSLSKIKQAMDKAGIDRKQFEPKKILSSISAAKSKGQSGQSYRLNVSGYWQEVVGEVWENYARILRAENSMDFDDLLLLTVLLLSEHDQIRAMYQDRFRYLHIDEYQDTNQVQYEMTRLLCGPADNICVVGDVDQSIYSWRGADYTNLLRFEEDHPKAKVVLLEQNYRSTQNILTAANAVIEKNVNRRDKKLFTQNGAGDKIRLDSFLDEGTESRAIADRAKQLVQNGQKAEEMAVLYRANFQSRALEEAFLKAGVSYQVLGVRFFERKEIKDILAYMQAALNDTDFDSLKRIINVPKRGIGKATLTKMAAGAEGDLPRATKEKIEAFRRLLERIRTKIETETMAATVKFILAESGLEKELLGEGEEGLERLENIKELVTLSQKYAHLEGAEAVLALLTEAALVSDQDTLNEKQNGVKLMTVHAAKGLEFDVVFVAGLEQGLFPHQGFGEKDRDEEEERRLFYVAVTRARTKLFLSYAQLRTIFGSQQVNTPSEFLMDIPDELLDSDVDPAAPTYEYLLDF